MIYTIFNCYTHIFVILASNWYQLFRFFANLFYFYVNIEYRKCLPVGTWLHAYMDVFAESNCFGCQNGEFVITAHTEQFWMLLSPPVSLCVPLYPSVSLCLPLCPSTSLCLHLSPPISHTRLLRRVRDSPTTGQPKVTAREQCCQIRDFVTRFNVFWRLYVTNSNCTGLVRKYAHYWVIFLLEIVYFGKKFARNLPIFEVRVKYFAFFFAVF